nr:hypothetical protein [Bactrian camel astrovirus]
MDQVPLRRGRLVRQQATREGETEPGRTRQSMCGCLPIKIRFAGRIPGFRASVTVWWSKRSSQRLAQLARTARGR